MFNHLSFSIGKGETVALMGRNGAGKTTLARMLCALEKPTTGSIVIDGIAVATAKANGGTKPLNRKNRTRLRRTVGYVMQHPERQLFADTVAEDVAYGPSNLGLDTSEAMERAMQAMRLLHIEHLRDRFAVRPVGRPAATGGDRRRDCMRAESVDSGRADRRS